VDEYRVIQSKRVQFIWRQCVSLILTVGICACSDRHPGPPAQTGSRPALAVDGASIGLFQQQPSEWLSTGRTYSEQHYSPLDRITAANVSRLGVAWEADLASPRFGIEATSVMAGGVLYVSSSWSRVFAFEAATGRKLWLYDPKVPGAWLRQGCCKPVSRGVAVWQDRVYVAAFDGRLIALDAATGREVWSADTTGKQSAYTITGAPRVVKGKVIIGNGGADFGVRGYISAYDAMTGKLAWRFYIVPGDPKKGFEHPELALAAKTWDPNRNWSIGGGGNAWDSFSYDPELDLLYVGTGNAGPWDPRVRNPGGGDSLFVSSILALKPDTGRLVWYYQTTPADMWDYNATQNMVLADMVAGGRTRKVLMQAPKNGFFYVLDRATGELISADKYARVNWAERVDLKTGRPVKTDAGDYTKGVTLVFPSPYGGHNWQPMSYSPKTGLVYIPAREIGWVWGAANPTWFFQGYDLHKLTNVDVLKSTQGRLIAWDPVNRKPIWTVPQKTITNGGTLVTAGGVVVQGTEDGYLRCYDAANGNLLREIFFGTGIVAAPISYSVGGEQYVAIAVGWNGVKTAPDDTNAPPPYDNAGRLIVLKLDGGPARVAQQQPLPPFFGDDTPQPTAAVLAGARLYHTYCYVCHSVVGESGVFPDLRRMSHATYYSFDNIVRGGALEPLGMASFADVLNTNDAANIRSYVVDWAQRSRRGLAAQSPSDPVKQHGVQGRRQGL
jgi:quinohemoprotein ethanol dehydrogenase